MSARNPGGFWETTKSCTLQWKWLFLLVKVSGIILSIGKFGKIGPRRMWQASKTTYIYLWAHEVENFEHIGLKSARTSGGFGKTIKFCRLQCKCLFLFVKVTRIIRSVEKLGKFEPRRLWRASKSTYIYWWAHEVGSSRHIGFCNVYNGQLQIIVVFKSMAFFVFVKLIGIIWYVGKLGNAGPRWL
jgi:hypothetical protein